MSALNAERDMEPGSVSALARRILNQRMSRYSDTEPDVSPIGSVRCRQDGARLLVAFATAHPGMASQVIDRVRMFARAHSQHIVWTVAPESPGEAEFPAALREAGFALEERLMLMGRQGPIDAHPSPQVRVAPLRTFEEMIAYERGSRQAFHNDPHPDERWTIARARERWRQQEQGWYRYYLALIGEQIVGGCYVSLWEDVPTLMGVYTLPAARGQGVASTALAVVTEDMTRIGRDSTCLYVKEGNPAHSLYLKLGFTDLTTEETYLETGVALI